MGWVEGTVCYIHVAEGSKPTHILYGKFLLSCECVRWFLLYQPLEIFRLQRLIEHYSVITPQSKAKVPLTVLAYTVTFAVSSNSTPGAR